MKNWIGKFMIGIGVLHTALGLVFLFPILLELFQEGLFHTVNGQPKREAFFWFIFSGVMMIVLGALVNWMELKGQMIPKFLGKALLGISTLVVFIMPLSGGWLMFAPAIGILLKK